MRSGEPVFVNKTNAFLHWFLWFAGAIVFVLAANLVPLGRLPFLRVESGHDGIRVFSIWAIAFLAMLGAMYLLRKVRLRTLLLAQVIVGIFFVFSPAMPSADPYAYFGFGEMLTHGENPWRTHVPTRSTEIVRTMSAEWGNPPITSPYGPAFVGFESLIIRAFPNAPLHDLVIVQRIISLIAIVGITMLVRGPNIAFWALNPYVFYFYVMNAHNDALFLALLAIGYRLRQPLLSGVFVGGAALIKIVAIAAVAFKGPRKAAIALAGVCIVLIAFFLTMPSAFHADPLVKQAHAMANSPATLLRFALEALRVPHHLAGALATGFVPLTLALVGIFMKWSKRDFPAIVALFGLLSLPYLWPWYFGWTLLAAVGTAHRRTLHAVVVISAMSFAMELPTFRLPSLELPVAVAALARAGLSFRPLRYIRFGWTASTLEG